MKINILDIERLIKVNEPHGSIGEVTSPFLISNKMYDPQGILSYDIFGISKGDRKTTFGYIDLGRPFLHPHIYTHVLKRMFRGIVHIVSGQRRYIVKDGELIEDAENGWTGLDSLYKNWEKIDWDKSKSSNERSITLLKQLPRTEAFVTKWIVCPPAYRDVILSGTVDNSLHVNELNKMYTNLIRNVNLLAEGGAFAAQSYATQDKVQTILGGIYDYFKDQVSSKTGLIRKYLMGKTVDFGTRSVISAPTYNKETMAENMVDIDHTALPIAQCCSTFYPFIESWLKGLFTREIINNPNLIAFYDPKKEKEIVATMKNPELQFSEKNIRKMINDYVFNPNNRFKIITVNALIPGEEKDREIKAYMLMKGEKVTGSETLVPFNRPMTITDILYMACVEVCEKRHVMITRYPVGTDKGIIMQKIRVQSTKNHIKVIFNGKEYPYYPDIDLNIPTEKVGVQFIDTAVFSNSMLDGMGGDYDGDTVFVRGLWTDEANKEAEDIMNRKMTALNITGTNSRVVSREIYNSYYALTKAGKEIGKVIPESLVNRYLELTPDGFTRSYISKMFADNVDNSVATNIKKRKALHNTWDKITIPQGYFYPNQPKIETTIGRFLFNKYVLEGSGIIEATKLHLEVLNKGTIGDLDNKIGNLYMEDIINRTQFNDYINRRDNLGYWLNGMLSHTISLKMSKPLREIEAFKKELYKKYTKEIADNDIRVMNDIEKQLIEKAKELLKDDPGMDLYNSGDLSFENAYKNNAILKGPVMNKITNEFDFIGSSFMDGIEIKDIPAHANSILAGQYPTSIATQKSGYMGKQLLALLQMMEIDVPGTDCKTKSLIPITVTQKNKNDLLYSYIQVKDQLQLLTPDNMKDYVGKNVMMRSPMSCVSSKICSLCAGELFYKLDVKQAGLFATQLSHSALNIALKAKHDTTLNLYEIDPNKVIEDI